MQTSTHLCDSARIYQLQQHWDQDRALRRCFPLSQSWRGCLGLGLLLHNPDDTESHGDLALVHNDQLKWLALRDVPAGSYFGERRRCRATYATSATAELRYGMPVVDFSKGSRESVDFNRRPFSRRVTMAGPPWELRVQRPAGDTFDASEICQFDVLNRISAAMTQFALFAIDALGRPWRPAWAKHRPAGGTCFQNVKPSALMPRPYLAFEIGAMQKLTDAIFCNPHPLPISLFDPFCRSLAEGLVLRTTEPAVYCCRIPNGAIRNLHQFKSTIDQSSRLVRLPPGSRVLVPRGRILDAAQPWARVLPMPLHESPLATPKELPARWMRLRKLLGGAEPLADLARLWFENQLIRLPSQPDRLLVPANLVGEVAREFAPLELWWDTAPALPYYDWEIQAAILPPVPLYRWDRLHLSMPVDVAINAGITDPRWSDSPIPQIPQPVCCRKNHFQPTGLLLAASPVDYPSAQLPVLQHHQSELQLAIAG